MLNSWEPLKKNAEWKRKLLIMDCRKLDSVRKKTTTLFYEDTLWCTFLMLRPIFCHLVATSCKHTKNKWLLFSILFCHWLLIWETSPWCQCYYYFFNRSSSLVCFCCCFCSSEVKAFTCLMSLSIQAVLSVFIQKSPSRFVSWATA